MAMRMPCVTALLAAAATMSVGNALPRGSAAPEVALYGLELVTNGPAKPGLVKVDPKTGKNTQVGPALDVESATGELGTVDTKRGVYYYLGDSSEGATLVGLKLSDGTKVCSAPVPLREIGFVGFGQSLDYDWKNDALVLSGVAMTNPNATAYHTVLRHALSKSTCGPFKSIGTFADAVYLPMLHGSAFDVGGQQLFVTVSVDKATMGIATIDLATGNMSSVAVEGASAVDVMVGMHWDSENQKIVSLTQGPGETGINLVTLDPVTGSWITKNIGGDYPVLQGNDGEVSAYDDASGLMTVGASKPGATRPGSGEADIHLVQVDVRTGVIHGASPELGVVGLGLLEQLVACVGCK